MKINQKGFTLAELLIVIAIIGLIAAIAIPNLLDAFDRSKQRANVADLHNWGLALSAYNVDRAGFPANTPGGLATPGLISLLVPYTINSLPLTDHWKHAWHYGTVDQLSGYTIASYGKNDVLDFGCTPQNWFTQNYQCDTVLVDGIFVSSPS